MNWRMAVGALALVLGVAGCGGGTTTPTCSDTETLCGTACVNTQVDSRHCGACDNACGEGQVCTEGACAVGCPTGQTECSGGCFDLTASDSHCGACGNACAEGERCTDGTCGVSCPGTQTVCDGACRDTATDRAHCGACGNACAADELCTAGSCQLLCATGFTACDGACRDTGVDRAHCGACGNACGDGELCVGGACTLTCTGFAGTDCSGTCTNTQVDPSHCGACGNACAAGQVCSQGTCASSCDASLDVCGGSCTDTQIDPANCGTCGTTCASPANAIGVCATGDCNAVCAADYADCNFDLLSSGTDGCESHLATSVDHCGACGNACPVPANATAACTTGTCGIGQCDMGFGNCDMDATTGCEVDLQADGANCGACGNACAAGQLCTSGACIALAGDSCGNEIVVTAGSNTINWVAVGQEYLTAAPSCMTFGTTEGPDIVAEYTPTVTGFATLSLAKPASTRWTMVVSSGTCGALTPEVSCSSEYSATTMGDTFPITANQTYFIYIVDTSSGSATLDNPLLLDITEVVPPCNPGQGGVVGTATTRVPTALTSHTEAYVAADSDPAGWVYYGGTTTLYRVPKAGGAQQTLHGTNGITSSQLGYTMLINGQDIYTVDNANTGTTPKTTGLLWRISSDGGATFAPTDVASFATAPADDFTGAAQSGTSIYLITNEGTGTVDTQIWSVDVSGTLPAAAVLEHSFGANAYNNCRGLAVDAQSFYTVCRVGTSSTNHPVLRIDRTTGAVTEVVAVFPGNTTAGAVYAVDTSADGIADVLYVRTNQREVYFVCGLDTAMPFAATLVSLAGSSTSSYGLGYDPVANALWAYEDAAGASGFHELVRIQ